jgi:hypothetical protein
MACSGSIDQGGPLYTGKDYLHRGTISGVIHLSDCVFAWSTKKIVSDTGTQFTSQFWQKLHESMDTKLNFSSAYHLQTDGQTERTNEVLEDMLRACALKHGGSWDKSLPFAEFSYNNSY